MLIEDADADDADDKRRGGGGISTTVGHHASVPGISATGCPRPDQRLQISSTNLATASCVCALRHLLVMSQKLLGELLQNLCACLPRSSYCCVTFITLRRDYCSSEIKNDQARGVVAAELCPSEMDNDEEVVVELSYVPRPLAPHSATRLLLMSAHLQVCTSSYRIGHHRCCHQRW